MDTHESASAGGNSALIASFSEITSASKEEALFFLESHNWDLDTAVSTFFDSSAAPPAIPPTAAPSIPNPLSPNSPSESYSPSQSPSRSRSPSPTSARAPYELRARRAADKQKRPDRVSGSRPRGGIRTFSDLNRSAKSDSDSDEPQEYYTGGQKSGMLVQDPTRGNDVDAIFNEARHAGAVEGPADHLQPSASSKTFTGTARLLSGETISSAPQQHQPEIVTHTITFWRNGFTVDDGPLRRLEDPENAPFLESIRKSECPGELEPADRKTSVHVNLMRRDENYSEPVRKPGSFQGVGRTLGSTSTAPATSDPTGTSLTTAPLPSLGLVVDESVPSTSIQLRLADGTRMVSRFNYHHTVGDIHAFINASRPGGMRNYQLQMMGFPPKQLNDLNQTIEQAGLASSVVIQKF